MLNGFEKASLRTICKKAELTTGALYFFFENKEDLFDCLVKDYASELKKMMVSFAETEKMEYQNSINGNKTEIQRSDIDHEKAMMSYFFANREVFVLLTRKAKGSSFEGFYNEIVGFMEQLFKEFVRLYQRREIVESAMMQNAIHCMVTSRVQTYLELLQSDISLDEALIQAEIIATYAVGGFEKVMHFISSKNT